ncbi:twin-arginine translocase TatA/TatE family subunit [Gaiella sp.]|jgi:sec-independent protein translocase protein TatA|uniref:twin-arginine translocase TatA/TatE family subunit n=1 Tax=Gaiella sp. TaxID=2663207 RepID=UPI002E321A2B|nr:twin-arginine translocase TatA/TatE family subunit [Gaiella sp.]HEX5585033.1 twin-arginine translocase TatA/TatE family subunit [Gaiella sp.]
MPFDVGPWEIVVLIGVLALLFGSKGVPDVARRLGRSVREVKETVGEVDPRRMLDSGVDPGESQASPDARDRRA